MSTCQDGMLFIFIVSNEYQPSGTLNFNKLDDAYLINVK